MARFSEIDHDRIPLDVKRLLVDVLGIDTRSPRDADNGLNYDDETVHVYFGRSMARRNRLRNSNVEVLNWYTHQLPGNPEPVDGNAPIVGAVIARSSI